MEWISVKDKMPRLKKYSEDELESNYVEVKLSNGEEYEAWYNTREGWENMTRKFTDVTHWKYIKNKKR